jgi:hypothetical protein
MPNKERPVESNEQARGRTQSKELKGKESLSSRLLAISKEAAPLWREPWRCVEHGDLLYGEDGLPLESE